MTDREFNERLQRVICVAIGEREDEIVRIGRSRKWRYLAVLFNVSTGVWWLIDVLNGASTSTKILCVFNFGCAAAIAGLSVYLDAFDVPRIRKEIKNLQESIRELVSLTE